MILALLLACLQPAPPPGDDALQLRGATLEAEGFTIRAAQATLAPDGAGSGQAVAASSPPLEIQAQRSTWSLADRSARFTGDVVATRADVTLRCATLDVRFASADRVQHATATGGVRLQQGERQVTADRAELDADSGQVTLTGSPRLTEGSNTLSGERIVLWLDQERLECEGCRLVVAGDAIAPRQ